MHVPYSICNNDDPRGRGGARKLCSFYFDFDGVIADSRQAIHLAASELERGRGMEPLSSEAHNNLSMLELKKQLGVRWYQVPYYVSKMRKQITKHRSFITLHAQIQPALDLIRQGTLSGAILSSNSPDVISYFMKTHCPQVPMRDIVGNISLFGKHRALRRLMRARGTGADGFIYVGDESRDIIAAQRVGMRCIAVTWGRDSAQGLAALKPTYVVNSAEELLAALTALHSV